MKKIFAILLLPIFATAVFAADDCVESPYNGKTYCCNVRDKNLPEGAENKSWGEVIPWDKYYGTVRKCVGGRATNDHFSYDQIKSIAAHTKIRKEASKYKVAYYNSFDGTYWNDPLCEYRCEYSNYPGSYYSDTTFDYNTGGCLFNGLLDTGDEIFTCGETCYHDAYVREITGKNITNVSNGTIIKRPPNEKNGGYWVVYSCLAERDSDLYWQRAPFCEESDMPTNAEITSGVLDRLSDGWLMRTDNGNEVDASIDSWEDHYDSRSSGNYVNWNCWTRGTATDVKSAKTDKKTTTQDGENKYNYKSCSSDSDCTNIDNTVRPYLHSTAWHCAWQSADVRVCTVTACESGWTPKDGYCQEDKTPAPTNTQNSTTGSTVQQVGQAGTTTVSKTTVKKTCSDPDNMDSNCKCVVPKTTVSGDKCVCVDTNKEIKNGKCEYTAEYISKIESDLDEKYASLMATIGGFEKNVWRDADGNFNTSRLVSDSVAGVVLGTVGGIVTSSLVKKAQVKKGFEDIGCYIGGQSVAGYGDEFMVGR